MQFSLSVNEDKVIDRVIDVYIWLNDFNTVEVIRLADHLTALAHRRATDVELVYCNRQQAQHLYPIEDEIQF